VSDIFDADGRELRILVEEPVWAPTSVLGNVLTLRHAHEALMTLKSWGYWEIARRNRDPEDWLTERDRRLVKAAGRWHGDPLRPPISGKFVPVDVAAMRLAVVTGDIARRAARRM
jgi:hypothetical protein